VRATILVCLLAAFAPEQAEAAVDAFRSDGVPASAIGVVESGTGVHDTNDEALAWPERDEALRVLEQQ
jgi:hydrogenase expression/formation protein HypE